MTSIIKSSQMFGEPVVLVRPQRWEAPELLEEQPPVAPTPADEAEGAVAEVGAFEASERMTHIGASEEPLLEEPAPQETSFSYEDYRRRFDEELSALEEQAKQRGYEQGHEEAFEKIKAEYGEQLEALAALVASMRGSLDQTIDGVAELGIEVICEAVAKVIGESAAERDVVISAVRQVIRRTKERAKLVVRLSSADWALLQDYEAQLVEGLSIGSVELVADDRVRAGGCLLETPAGNLDGRFEVQLERLREALHNARDADDEAEAAA